MMHFLLASALIFVLPKAVRPASDHSATANRCSKIDGGEVFSVYYNNEGRINSTANLMCNDINKRIVGCSLMTCLPSGKWTICNPTCADYIPTSCPRFPETPFLLVDYSRRTSIGSVATFSCSSSSKVLVGSSKSYCLSNFVWSNPAASCEGSCSVPSMENGEYGRFGIPNVPWSFREEFIRIPQGETVKPFETLFVRCTRDFFLMDDSKLIENGRIEVTCRDGSWSKNPQCRASKEDITCPWFSLSSDLSVSYTDGNKVNSSATFSCQNNVKLVGSGHVGCQSNGKWSSSKPSCEDMNCPRFRDTPELIVWYSKDVSVSSIATFRCSSSDRNLVGQSASICQKNGTWSNPLPSCEATNIRCPPINGGEVFSTYYNNERRINSTAIFMCRDNSKKIDGCSSVTCLPSGEWTRCNPSCVATNIRCPPINGGEVFSAYYNDERRINSTAIFLCRDNSKKIDGCSSVTCLPSGEWTRCDPSCVDEFRCKSPAKTPGSMLILSPPKDMFSLGERLHFSCPAGMNLTSGSQVIMCLKNGWSETLPNCKGNGNVSCPKFPGSPGLDVTYSKNMSVGSVAKFSCFPSTRNLVGNPVSTCQETRSWSSHLPSCEDTKCSIRDLMTTISEDVELDMIDVTGDFKANSMVRLKCRDHSVINGNSNVVCGEDGKWKLGNYQCALGCILNIDSSSHLQADPVKNIYRFGEFVVLKCARGYLMTEDVERMMCLGSTWSDSLPSCKPWRQRN